MTSAMLSMKFLLDRMERNLYYWLVTILYFAGCEMLVVM